MWKDEKKILSERSENGETEEYQTESRLTRIDFDYLSDSKYFLLNDNANCFTMKADIFGENWTEIS